MEYILLLFFSLPFINLSLQAKLKLEYKQLAEFLVFDACRTKKQLITSKRNEEFELVESMVNSTLTLACHFCDETDDKVPKLWYRQSRFRDSNITEVELGMEDELSNNRVYMMPDHTLVFNQTIEEDAALYYCSGRLGEDREFKFNYLVDFINGTARKVTMGDIKDWKSFEAAAFTEINEQFASSSRSDYALIRSMGILIEVLGVWQPWGTCDGCKKTRFKIEECRLQPSLQNNNLTSVQFLNDSEAFLLKSFEMSCFSLSFRKFFPNISDDLDDVGTFAVTEPCYAPCKVDSKSKSLAHYKNTVVLIEGDHFTLICPEVTVESEVRWEKDGVAIRPNIQGGNIIIDTFSNLYIISATTSEEANYTCYVDDVKMQIVTVYVRQQFVLSSEDLLPLV